MGQVNMAHTKFDLKMGQLDLAHYSISLDPNLKWANLTWPIIKFLTFLMLGQVDLAHLFFSHLLRIFFLHLVSRDRSQALDHKNEEKTEMGQIDLAHYHMWFLI